MMTKICPKCKENLHPTMPGVYGCGTPVRRSRDGSLFETKKCLRRQLAQAKAVIHAAYCEGWEDRDDGAFSEHLGEAEMDADWQSSVTREAAEAAKKEPATDGKRTL